MKPLPEVVRELREYSVDAFLLRRRCIEAADLLATLAREKADHLARLESLASEYERLGSCHRGVDHPPSVFASCGRDLRALLSPADDTGPPDTMPSVIVPDYR